MSDTTISDSTPHNVAELGMLCRRLERQINAANVEMDEKRKDIVYLATEKAKLEERIKRLEEELMDTKNKHAVLVADVVLNEDRAERIKRLEEAGDTVAAIIGPPGSAHLADENQVDAAWNNWTKAKEDKP